MGWLMLGRDPGQSLVLSGGPFRTPIVVTFLDTGDGVSIVDANARQLGYVADDAYPSAAVELGPSVRLSILNTDLRMLEIRQRRQAGVCIQCGRNPAPRDVLRCYACLNSGDRNAWESWLNLGI